MINLGSTRTPRSFSAELPSSWLAPSVCWYIGLLLPWGRTWHFLLLSFPEVPVNPLYQTSELTLNGSRTLLCISHSSQFCLLFRSAKVHSVPSSRPPVKKLAWVSDSSGTSHHQWLAASCAADRNPLSLAVQSYINLPRCPLSYLHFVGCLWGYEGIRCWKPY